MFILLATALVGPSPKLAVTVTFHKSAIELFHLDGVELKNNILSALQYYILYPNQNLGSVNLRQFLSKNFKAENNLFSLLFPNDSKNQQKKVTLDFGKWWQKTLKQSK